MYRLIFIVLLFCLGCSSDISLKDVRLDSLLNDNSSKVWLVDKVFHEGKDIAPLRIQFRDILIFYQSGRVALQPLNTLGNKQATVGYFFLNSDNTELTIDFKKDFWIFEIKHISEEKIVLKPKERSTIQYDLELIPLPEL